MTQVATLSKILQIKEKEMLDVQLEHVASIEAFETVATELYELLKRKENAESAQEEALQDSFSIEEMLEQMNYIDSLHKRILFVQQKVNEARSRMNEKQEELTAAHVEMKKYESIIKRRNEEQLAEENRIKRALMDEVSMQQFLKQKGGTYG